MTGKHAVHGSKADAESREYARDWKEIARRDDRAAHREDRTMPTQRQVSVKFWSSPQVRQAKPTTRLFMLWVMTGPRATLPGIFRFSGDDATEDTGLTRQQIQRAIAEAGAPGPDGEPFLQFDRVTRVMWICKRLAYEFPDGKLSRLQREGIRRVLSDLPRCPLVLALSNAYRAWGEPFASLADDLSRTLSDTHPDTLAPTHADTPPREASSSLLSASSSQFSASRSPLSASSSQLPGNTTASQVTFTPRGFDVPQELLDRWRVAYPAVDIEVEIRRASEWASANPTRFRRKQNLARFLTGWLGGAQDRRPPGWVRRPDLSPDARKEEILKAIDGDQTP